MSNKCHRAACGKTVFHAEKKEHDGKIFHSRCFNLWKKEEEEAKRDKNNRENYEKSADVAPAYYRVADPTTGAEARMQTGVEDRAQRPPSQPAAAAGGAGPKFCPECGGTNSGGKFCG